MVNEAEIRIEADILIVGHGIAGLAAAISAKENAPDMKVVTVDKCFPGYSGKANKGGGHVAFIPEGEEETYVEYHVRNCGDYLNDQDMLRIYANSTIKTMDRWESWGVKFVLSKEESLNAHMLIPWKITLVDLDIMIHMAKHAKSLGIESYSKIAISDLLMDSNRVAGAFGASLIDGQPYVFQAKSVILACGDQNWSIMNMWNGKGDGIAAAYRVGAKMRNAEFGSFMNVMTLSSKTVAYGAEDVLYNAQGESCTDRADLDEDLKSVVGGVDLGGSQSVLMYLDVRDGKGPIYEDTTQNEFPGSWIGRNLVCYGGEADEEYRRPLAQKFWDKLYFKNRMESFRDDNPMKEAVPGVVGECSPLYVNHSMETSIRGLFAAGDICGNGGAWSGAVPTPPGRNRGSGLMHAVMTSNIAADSSVKYAQASIYGTIDPSQVQLCKDRLFAPIEAYGEITPQEFMWEIKSLMQPVEYTGYKSEERLQRALDRVLDLKKEIDKIKAIDAHSMIAANECRSTLLCAEMFFRSSLARKESRGWHMREDYKERNDKEFMKWIVLQDQNGEMNLTYEDLPIETYMYKPE